VEDEKKELPLIDIAPSDLQVIGSILFPYARMIQCVIEPSSKRDTILRTVEMLRQRIADVKNVERVGKDPFPLSRNELVVIDNALSAFVENISRFVPQSQERDETMRACKALRSYLISSFAQTGVPTNN